MKNTTRRSHDQLAALVEGALMVALAVVLDLIPLPHWPQGGSISLTMIPIAYYSLRRGWRWGALAGLVNAAVQLVSGWDPPPANTLAAFVGCILLDYIVAYAVIGLAELFAKPFARHRLVGYSLGTLAVCLVRFVCTFLSGVLIWDAYAPEGISLWWYSLTYNGSYLIPNIILTTVAVTLISIALDPKTLRPMKKDH